MTNTIMQKPTAAELKELDSLMADPKKRLKILKEFNRLMEEFFVWKEKEKKKQGMEKHEKSLIGKLLEKIKNL